MDREYLKGQMKLCNEEYEGEKYLQNQCRYQLAEEVSEQLIRNAIAACGAGISPAEVVAIQNHTNSKSGKDAYIFTCDQVYGKSIKKYVITLDHLSERSLTSLKSGADWSMSF